MITIRPVTEADRTDWLRMRVALWPAEIAAHAPDVGRFFGGRREAHRALGFEEMAEIRCFRKVLNDR